MAYTTELKEMMVAELYADIDRNFRDPFHDYASCNPTPKYDHEKFLKGEQKQGLFESIRHDGVKVPLWAALLTGDEAKKASEKANREVIARIIRGHRRLVAVEKINELYPNSILSVPVILYTGLDVPEEWALMADHGGANREEGLSELGQYRACINLFGTGKFSQDAIGRMLGETRGWAMRRVWIHQMNPKTQIETEFLKRFEPEKFKAGSYYSFTYKDVEDLHKAFSTDEKDGKDPLKDGSEFFKVWSRFAATGEAAPAAPKALTRQKIDERDSFVAGRPALEELMRFASGRGGNAGDAAKMYDRVNEKAQKADSLATELETANARIVSLESELASAMESVTALTAEITALKAESKATKPTPASGQSRKGR